MSDILSVAAVKIILSKGICSSHPLFPSSYLATIFVKFNISNTLVLIFGNHSNLFIDHLNFINSNYYKFINLNELANFLRLNLKIYKYNYVLFSPGGESFDYYKNYLDRGKHFNKLIKKVLI